MAFFKYGKEGTLQPLANDATDKEIFNADAASLWISNQKNGHAGACIQHTAIVDNKTACPANVLARRCIHIRQASGTDMLLFAYILMRQAWGLSLTIKSALQLVKFAAKSLHYDKRDIPIDRVDTHSLMSGVCAPSIWQDTMWRRSRRWGVGSPSQTFSWNTSSSNYQYSQKE